MSCLVGHRSVQKLDRKSKISSSAKTKPATHRLLTQFVRTILAMTSMTAAGDVQRVRLTSSRSPLGEG
jgi:hypothetical protein